MKIDKELYKKIQDITLQDYNGIEILEWMFITSEMISAIIEDLIVEYHKKEEEIEDIKQDIEENYERIPIWKQVL